MNIRDIEKFQSTFWDWTPYNTAFDNPAVRISDIDGHVERKGQFLFIETKLTGNKPTLAQEISIRANVAKGNTVLLVEGQTNKPEKIIVYLRNGKTRVYDNADEDTLMMIVREWWIWASKKPRLSNDTMTARKQVIRELFDTLTADEKASLLAQLSE